jgi:long-chain fatty acid transport protein
MNLGGEVKMKIQSTTAIVGCLCVSAWSLNKNQSIEFSQDLNRNASTDADAAFHNPAGLAFLPTDGLYLGGGNQFIAQDRAIGEANPLLQSQGRSEYQGTIQVPLFPTVHAAYKTGDLTFFAHGGPLGGGGEGVYDQGLPKFDNLILGFANGVAAQVKAAVDTGYQRQLAAAGLAGMHVTNNATATLQYQRDLSFTGNEMTLGGTVGAAYKVLPNLAVSGAYRLSYARNAYQGTARVKSLGVAYQGSQGAAPAGISGGSIDTLLTAQTNHVLDSLWRDVEVDVVGTGMAHGAVVGLDFMPTEDWNFGVRFEWNGQMELENKTATLKAPDALLPYLAPYADGARAKITEPMVLAGGVAWNGIKDLTLQSSWTYGFDEMVDHDGKEADYHNSLFAGLGARYQMTRRIEGAVGYAYDWAFKGDAARDEIDPDIPFHFVAVGCKVQATPRLKVHAGAMTGFGKDRKGTSVASGLSQTMSSKHRSLALGLEWSPPI